MLVEDLHGSTPAQILAEGEKRSSKSMRQSVACVLIEIYTGGLFGEAIIASLSISVHNIQQLTVCCA